MYDFLLQTILFVSLGIIIYLLARAVPRVNDVGETVHHAPGKFDKILRRLPLEKIDGRLNILFEKFLRRTRVVIMKMDNSVNYRLGRLKKTNGENGNGSGNLFEKINSDTKE